MRRHRSSPADDWIGGLVVIAFLAALIYGWSCNIVVIVQSDLSASATGMFICRVIGIFVWPLGAVLGYF